MALGKLFRALQPKKGSVEELSESYLIACHKCTKHALEAVIVKLIRGEIEGVSKAFAPSSAELSAAIRSEMQWVEKQIKLAEDRMQIEDNRPVARPAMLLQDRVDAAKRKMLDEERTYLFSTESHASVGTRRRDVPAGSIYVGILGAFYGPIGSMRPPVVEEPQLFEPEIEPPAAAAPAPALEEVEF
jgi:hypothetical protein